MVVINFRDANLHQTVQIEYNITYQSAYV